ncbi:DUF6612 family protein [Sporosarcina sp. FA9]|uniref:DUF6612 family protein n=1 Tax=Sporosarcina sp. FA9 TaxID=3413030 RepID=UPI003F655664
MKNWIKGIATGILVLGLAACGSIADVMPGTDTSKKSELTILEVFQKAQETSEKQNSLHAKMDIVQNMDSPVEGLNMDMKIKMDMDVIVEPLAMHQVIEMDMGEAGIMETELYLTEDGFLMKDPESEEWMKLPEELYEEVMGSMADGADPTLDLNLLEEYIEDFTFEQDDNQYVLKLKASGEKFKNLVKEQLDSSGMLDGMDEEDAKVLESMIIHEMEYEIFIDKKTFSTTAFTMIMDMEMGPEDGTMRIKQNTKAEISKINELKEIKVPQEVLDAVTE